MRVRKYIVDTMPEAMLSIRKDLGSDAVILSSKEIKVGGFLGMFTSRKIEVIAAVEKNETVKTEKAQPKAVKPDGDQREAEAAAIAPKPHIPRQAAASVYKTSARVNTESLKSPEELDGKAKTPQQSEPQAPRADKHLKREDESQSRAAAETAAGALSTTGFRSGVASAKFEAWSTEEEPSFNRSAAEQKLFDEIREMKDWIARLSRQTAAKEVLPDAIASIRDSLIGQGLSPAIFQLWVEEAVMKWNEAGGELSAEELKDLFISQAASFLEGRIGGGIQPDTRIVYVAGPTGVGKTTTIAKLAAEQMFKYRRKVGFITADTYRISAVEQLKTYASILNLPIEVVQTSEDMQRALENLKACDLILMDTAGRNYRSELFVSELHSLLPENHESETYLVLSLTSKSEDMEHITGHFSKYGLDKVIFTKLDETGSCGAIYNLLSTFPVQLSYMTNGQNVPDDLLMPDKNMLARMLFGETPA
ncbi:flagellar biosynthesis protein FlhF [Paenibacillus sp. F411]|uniref:flagellar biosynthesis protein FlhF n=1 Tax=Paenibacillus sp. F411 TaxID=2820239 RepID=UPI001AAF7E5E|nr:flagellar biosynthesis protein FlhF [Paenibacillus sp. F411]MBO2945738.1 flagellar biosynthesis protein FlhF [Paenibacillus sp. F411]